MNDNGCNFDKSPPVDVSNYDQSIRLFCGAYEEIFTLSHCVLRASLKENAEVLVVGAGTGMEIVSFGPKNPAWLFHGVDPSGDMLALAKRKIAEANIENRVQLTQGYVDDLGDRVFDGAACILVMHFLEDNGAKGSLLKSIRNHLVPGAPLVLVDGCGSPRDPAFRKVMAAWMQYPRLHGVEAEVVETAFREVISKRVRFVPEHRIVELLEQAGFENVFRFYTGFLYSGWGSFRA